MKNKIIMFGFIRLILVFPLACLPVMSLSCRTAATLSAKNVIVSSDKRTEEVPPAPSERSPAVTEGNEPRQTETAGRPAFKGTRMTIEQDILWMDLARKLRTTVDVLNRINKLNLAPEVIIAAGSEIYILGPLL